MGKFSLKKISYGFLSYVITTILLVLINFEAKVLFVNNFFVTLSNFFFDLYVYKTNIFIWIIVNLFLTFLFSTIGNRNDKKRWLFVFLNLALNIFLIISLPFQSLFLLLLGGFVSPS